jgi:hypothetical protein
MWFFVLLLTVQIELLFGIFDQAVAAPKRPKAPCLGKRGGNFAALSEVQPLLS